MARRTILVIGGSGGLGRAVVEHLAGQGHAVAFTYRRGGRAADELAARAEGAARAFALDLRDAKGPERVAAAAEQALGPLDGLVNAAGRGAGGLLAMTPDDTWDDVLDTNLGGVFRCCRAVLPGMVKRRRGSIVNVASLAALRGVAGQTSYAASKAGVLGLTRSLAREMGRRGIRVNAVAPGYVPTEMTRDLDPAEVAALRSRECLPDGVSPASVAAAIAFLLSDSAASITGQCLVVDAGASV